MKLHKILKSKAVLALVPLLAHQSAMAVSMTVDTIVAPGDVNAAYLSGTVNMSLSGSVLTINLKNTSADAAGSGAGILLTGIGFNLPTGVYIGSGSANMGSATAIGFIKPAGGNVSSEWGYDNAPLNSGALLGYPVNTAVSSMQSQTTAQFAPGSIGNPLNLGGPDFGLISANEKDGLGDGVEGILDSLTITLNLAGTIAGDLLAFIERGTIAVTFGSPGSQTVADGGSTLMLLGSSFGVLAYLARRRKALAKE